jgi:uncharacterized membrane protein YsdA (DUF1294 family)
MWWTVLINLVSFLLFAWDKAMASRGWWWKIRFAF